MRYEVLVIDSNPWRYSLLWCYLGQESAPFVERDSVQGKLPKEQREQNGDKESLLRKPDFVTDLDVSKEPLKIRN